MSPIKWRVPLSALIALAALTTICKSKELCEPWKREELQNAEHFSNKSVWDPGSQLLYSPNSYWKDTKNGTFYGCPCQLEKPCLRKCCQKNEAMDYDSLECIPHNATWPWFRLNVPEDEEGNFRMEEIDYFGLIIGNYCLGYLLEPEFYPDEDQFFVNFTNGALSMPKGKKFGLGPEDYCLEYLPAKDVYLPYLCFRTLGKGKPPPDKCHRLRYIFYPFGMMVSTIFLVISLLVYILIPELRNFHGKCLMCHMASLLCAYIFLSSVLGIGKLLSDTACITFGFIIYFSLLCSFFWLNIMCVDICIAFSSMRPMSGTLPEREMKKFLLYMLYAWGIPLVIILITVIIELHPDVPDTLYKPEFRRTCWFDSEASRMAYFVGPIGVIVLCNIILFLVTARNIFKMKKETKMLTKGDSKRHNKKEDRNRFKLYIKLSIVMGISWAMEILSWLIGGSKCIWVFTDTLNTLQGLFIFLIFVWKKKVRHMVKRRLCPNRVNDSSIQMEGGSSGGTTGSTSTTSAPSSSINGSGKLAQQKKNVNGPICNSQTTPAKSGQETTGF